MALSSLGGQVQLSDHWWFGLLLNATGLGALGEFGVELRANEHREPRPIEPDHECDRRPQRAVGPIEVRETAEVNDEQIRKRDTASYCEEGSGKSCAKARLHVGGDEVYGLDGKDREENGMAP